MGASICFFLHSGHPQSGLAPERSNTVLADHYWDFINKDWNEPDFRTTALGPYVEFGIIRPTAAFSSIPCPYKESMEALCYFYNVLGQGPIIVMKENYHTGLLWKYFMQHPDVPQGLKKFGFKSPLIL